MSLHEQDALLHSVQRGWWRERSSLDLLDKRLSGHVFALELGIVAEILLIIPGTWLGIPISAFTLANLLTYLAMENEPNAHWLPELMQVWVFESHPSNFLLLVGAFLLGWSGYFFTHLLRDNITPAYLANKRFMLPAMGMPIWMGGVFSSKAYKSACFFIVAWFVGQMVSTALKIGFARMRPMVSHAKLGLGSRRFTSVQQMLGAGESAFESFPSGDTVGSAAFASTLFLMGVPHAMWIGVLTGFCRMYFHAHHLLDVVVGFAIGWFVPVGMVALGFDLEYFAAPQVLGVVVVAIAYFIKIQQFKPDLPEHLMVKGRKGF
ncbi:hypothetical protein BASA81_012834 [Batrachochytrium salamandrivorans]|nr:hypothetical protein BASA81_012834 [Batrachochytrium salamandrivorans]